MSQIEINNVVKRYGETEIIRDISFDIDAGQFTVIVGPSGCGKSTLLRSIAGLEDINSGEIKIDGKVINDVPPHLRGIAMVFQTYALYPHMTVAQNIGFGLKLQKIDKSELRKRVAETAEILELGHLLNRKPSELSGGQRQRVAIGRALVKRPKIILFDEPLSNLDAALRVQMRTELLRLHKEFDSTILYVTHDQVEAMTMAEQIVVLNKGLIAQKGSPLTLYRQPENTFVAQFIGVPKMNLLPSSIIGDNLIKSDSIQTEQFVTRNAIEEIGIRPEHLILQRNDDSQGPWTLIYSERLGVETYLHLEQASLDQNIIVRLEGDCEFQAGDRLNLMVQHTHCHFFDNKGKRVCPKGMNTGEAKCA